MNEQPSNENIVKKPQRRGKLFARFRRVNTLFFAAAFFLMAAIMVLLIDGVIGKTSKEHAGRYAASTAEALSAHVEKEVGLMSKAARSIAVTEWLADENEPTKKKTAFNELAGVIKELYGYNLYVGFESSRNEYSIETGETPPDIQPFALLDKDDPADDWYFACVDSDQEYMTNIGIDLYLQRKRLWLNYKVVSGGVTLGVIATGLEFEHVVDELFSHFESTEMRGLIIDKDGIIRMDSALIDDEDFLLKGYEKHIDEEFTNPAILNAIKSRLREITGYTTESGTPEVIVTSAGAFRYVTIAPIRSTDWVVVLLSKDASLFDMKNFVPLLITALALLSIVTFSTNFVNYKLIFKPLGLLSGSIKTLKDSLEVTVYGADRNDELGELSTVIEDLFNKANVDALTGIYNRRFMESSLDQIMAMLSRESGMLSLLMIDIDFFKRFNDTFGHDQGDVCLKAVANAIVGGISRASDFAARYGGEEFIVVLPNTGETGARNIAVKLLRSIYDLEIPHPHNDAAQYVTISVGVTTGAVTYGQSWEELVKRADEALYASKQSGRNKYTFLNY